MNPTKSQPGDAVPGNSSALDAVLGSFDFGTAMWFDDDSNEPTDSNNIGDDFSLQELSFRLEARKKRLPWLGA